MNEKQLPPLQNLRNLMKKIDENCICNNCLVNSCCSIGEEKDCIELIKQAEEWIEKRKKGEGKR